jgi:hypothetical protein
MSSRRHGTVTIPITLLPGVPAMYTVAVRILVSIALAGLFVSCSERDVKTPTDLVPGVTSFLSYEQVRDQIIAGSSGWETIEDTRNPLNDKRPPYHLQTIANGNFMSLAETGEARLIFFNDRLMSVWFFPREPQRYVRKLATEKSIDLTSNKEVGVGFATRVTMGKDLRGRVYILFEDTRLQKEHTDWIRRFS